MKYEPEKFEASGIHEVRELGMGKDLSRDICNMLNAVGGWGMECSALTRRIRGTCGGKNVQGNK